MASQKFAFNPHISVDCVVFGFDGDVIKVLLIKRKQEGRDVYALPGDLLGVKEDLDHAASRILSDLTGLTDIYLQQYKTFGELDRLSNPVDIEWLSKIREHPEERVVTIAYYSLIKIENLSIKPNSFPTTSLLSSVTRSESRLISAVIRSWWECHTMIRTVTAQGQLTSSSVIRAARRTGGRSLN